MRNNFSDLFRNQSENNLGISQSEVERALKDPDKKETLELEKIEKRLVGEASTPPFSPTFYLNNEEKGYLLVSTRIEDEVRHIDYALKIFPVFFEEDIDDLNPIEALKKLTYTFGLQIRIGEKSSKVISAAVIPYEGKTEIISIKNPKNHSFVNSFYLRPDKKIGKVICALAICIDTTRYKAWIENVF